MNNKVRQNITSITINAPTYTNVAFEPTMLNFFYGKNGTGKSTLGRSFKNGWAWLTWSDAPYPGDQIFVYNEDFIKRNIQSYGNIPGVFTISEVNAQKKKEADEKLIAKKEKDSSIKANNGKISKIDEEQQTADETYITDIWKATDALRSRFPLALMYLRDKKKFVGKIEEATPFAATIEDFEILYDTVFSTGQLSYQEYSLISSTVLPSSELLAKPIISSSNTEFAKFIRALGNLDWVTRGHNEYEAKADGKCPYCQGELSETFSTDLASCYDEQYKKEKEEFEQFIETYRNALNTIVREIKDNLNNTWDTPLAPDYAAKYELFLEIGKSNMAELNKKKENLSIEITLQDLSDLLTEINNIAASINKEIKQHNDVVADIPNQQKQCSRTLWKHLRHICETIVSVHAAQKSRRDELKEQLKKENKVLAEESQQLEVEAAKLNSQTVNTTKAMQDINKAIRSAGFRGFHLQEKAGAKYVYELVRDGNGKADVVEQNLSEGERNFIAFLYFYHIVMGSQSDEGKIVDKIVVIDDPVSSMDSSSLFIVASLVREMIAVCYNNYDMNKSGGDDHIRQFFCMTHNPYFFREITYNRISDYECASFFEIKKNKENQTSIEECTDEIKFSGGGKINRSPVRNTYDALWHEYVNTDDSETLMMVMRQILEYYFIQMVGFKSGNLRHELLDENEKEFVKILDDGTEDRTDYIAASAMIAMLNVGATGFNDGLYYDSSAVSVSDLRSVFERIFKVMHQEQHLKMMIKR